jgi:serine protease Do
MTRRRLFLTLALAAWSAAPALAQVADPPAVAKAAKAAWDITRTTAPADLAELRALEATVKRVVEKCTPATVGVQIGGAAGSAVIVSPDGLVLTAAHVSGKAGRECTLILPDGSKVKAKTLGFNTDIDAGMMQITEKAKTPDGKWPYLPTAKSADLKKGQWVVTLGHPGGWRPGRQPVARLGQVIESQSTLIRTNCTLVGGDSGGPLFDLDGNVIGIHSRIGLTLNHNIHVPLDGFKAEWDGMVAGKHVGRSAPKAAAPKAYFGVEFDDAPAAVKGARLKDVLDGSPAAKGGLKAGDLIVAMDGQVVESVDEARDVLKRRRPGDEIEVRVRRGGQTVTLTVALGRATE